MTETAHKPATYADLEKVPSHLVAEILFGHLVPHPRPVRRHGGAASALGMAVGNPYQLGEVPPDWICEILSPRTEKYDKGNKHRIYALYEVDSLCHLDPRTKLLDVFRRQGKDWLLTHTFQDEEDVSAPPFDAISFSLGHLWLFDTPGQQVDPTQ